MRRDLRLVPFAVSSWACALLAISLPSAAAVLAIGLWASAGAALVLLLRRPRRHAGASAGVAAAPAGCRSGGQASERRGPRRGRGARVRCMAGPRARGLLGLAAACLAAAALSASHVALAQPERSAIDGVRLSGGRSITVEGQVASKVERGARGELRFDVDARRIEIGTQVREVRIPITVTVDPGAVSTRGGAPLDLGSTIRASGTSRPTEPPRRSVLLVFASREVEVTRGPPWPLSISAETRTAFVARASTLPSPGGELLPGLAVGDTRAVGTELDVAMKVSSLSHLTAVSGATCALVVGIAFGLAALLRAPRWGRVASGIAALAAFVVLVTPEPSVVRAAAMATIAMLAVLLGRTGAGIGVLSLAVTVLLSADPWLAASLGFALSAAATAGLLVLSRPLAASLARWMPRGLALALAVPLAAQLACGPLLVLIAPQVPVYGVVANLLAAPAAPIATVVGLIACVTAALPWLAAPFMWIGWASAAWISATATTFAEAPLASAPWVEGVAGALALAGAGGVVVWLLHPPSAPGRLHRAMRRGAALTLAGLLGVAGGTTLVHTALAPALLPRDWAIAFCDVGQGDAIVVRSAGRTMLIDTGPEPEPLVRCLSRLGIARIDQLVLTHFDLDHIGGVSAVLGRTAEVLHGSPAGASDRRLIDRLTAAGARARVTAAGERGRLGDAAWRVLWPRAIGQAYREGNDASVVIEVDVAGLRAILLGDLGAGAQRALLASNALAGAYDVVKVAHHGSADQAPALYERIAPTLAVFTVGVGNPFGHPREAALRALAASGATLARTDESGLILLSPAGAQLRIWREVQPAERGDELEVLPWDSD
ncbi:MAG: ComEC/Rec2 family competence protein [Microbacteriaceae bacterium]|jgi:competence protein ComEC|nr:ComEC/Rec2 family competence protein [Microbacteriaceae bacterium]HPZ34166.1 ComEC/Rec2 family competence protein [Microbacteriaceae bacterium]HQC93307.1 ComEC/Rec2 family competence protein [Microbacteriaceae bacterium]